MCPTSMIGLKCIIIVNNLNSNKNQIDILRNIWNITNELHNMIVKTNDNEIDNTDIKKIKERDYNVLQKIKTAQKRLVEMKRSITSISQITKDIENDIIETISLFTNEVTKNDFNKYEIIKEWWNNNVEFSGNNDNKLTSTEIWIRFKKENKVYIEEHNLLIEEFKCNLKNLIDIEYYLEKSKKGSLEFIGFKFKDLLVKEEEIEVELIPTIIKKNKSAKKNSNKKIVIDEVVDNEIVEKYTNTENNIISISKEKSILVWQVVSILMNNKIIGKRSDARGYDIYKDSDEYKSKIVNKSYDEYSCELI